MRRTALLADRVLRERAGALERRRGPSCARPRWRGAHARARGRLGALRFTPVVVAATTLGVGACAGTAYAVFTATASASSQSAVSTLKAVLVLPATGASTMPLYPGQSAPLRLTLTNPNPSAVTITDVSQSGTVTVVGGSGCTSANSGVSVPTQSSLDIQLAPGTHSFTLATGASMATTSYTGCQGASFRVPLAVRVST